MTEAGWMPKVMHFEDERKVNGPRITGSLEKLKEARMDVS